MNGHSTALLASMLLFAPPATAFALPPTRLVLHGGPAFVVDEAFQAQADSRVEGVSETGLEVGMSPSLFIGLSYVARTRSGDVFQTFQTQLDGDAVRLSASYALRPLSTLMLYGRAGVSAFFWSQAFTFGDQRLESEDMTPAFLGALGLDFFFHVPKAPGSAAFEDRLGLGLNVELTYERFIPLELEARGTSLGAFDPSGPGLLLGLVANF